MTFIFIYVIINIWQLYVEDTMPDCKKSPKKAAKGRTSSPPRFPAQLNAVQAALLKRAGERFRQHQMKVGKAPTLH